MTVINTIGAEGQNVPINIPSGAGVSPIGTSSPNSSSTAATNTSYAGGAFTSGVGVVSANAYTIQNTNYQGTTQFTASGAIAVTLNSAVNQNFTCTLLNLGSGTITLTPTLGYLINGAASVTMPVSAGCQVSFANRAWTEFIGVTALQTVPVNTPATTGEYLVAYNSSTGAFTKSTPAGISATIVTAALTTLGTQGSMTFAGGILTASTPAT